MAEDSENKAAILAAARAALARDGKFTLRGVRAEAGVTRNVLSRCFGGKKELVAALVADDAQNLSGMIVAAPKALPQAVGAEQNVFYVDTATVAPHREPRLLRHGEIGRVLEERQVKETEGALKAEAGAGRAPDAWLERRLRVFERALNNIETREDKSERERMSGLSALEESLRQLGEAFAQSEARSCAAAQELRAQLGELTMRIGALELARLAPAPEPLPVVPHFTLAEEIEQAAPDEKPAAEKELPAPMPDSFIAQARRTAQAAQIAAAEIPEPANDDKTRSRWLIIGAVAIILLLACATFALAEFSRARDAQQLAHDNGVAHRHPALTQADRLTMLADGGDAQAQTIMALHYLRGEGLPQSNAAAARWISLAAAQGQAVAQYVLGTLYLQGEGLAPDAHAAFGWFQAAAQHGNRKAMHNLAIAYAQGAGVAKNPQEAARWFARAAMLGYVDSQFDLAVLYERGEGVPQSLTDAYKWYAIAAAQGDAPSASRIEALRSQLPPGDVAAAARAAKAFAPQPFDTSANIAPGKGA